MQASERVQTEIQRVIGDDPTISEANRIIVSVEKKGFWLSAKECVLLKGHVHADLDRQKAEKIAQLHSGGRQVINEISVLQ